MAWVDPEKKVLIESEAGEQRDNQQGFADECRRKEKYTSDPSL